MSRGALLLGILAWLLTALLAFLTTPLWLPVYVLVPGDFTGMVMRWLAWGERLLLAAEQLQTKEER